jgi:formiminoglutamase
VWSEFLKRWESTGMYLPANPALWSGRIDSPEETRAFRLHQLADFDASARAGIEPGGNTAPRIGLIGFAVDRGVQRNHGRIGAAEGPDAIRKKLATLPIPWREDRPAISRLADFGTIRIDQAATDDLERAQLCLAEAVSAIRAEGYLSLVLGGGHETAWGHFSGLAAASGPSGSSPPAIINIDAHLDMRPDRPGSSGTPFDQAADFCQEIGKGFSYFCAGLREEANTRFLLDHAQRRGGRWCSLSDLRRAVDPPGGGDETGLPEELAAFIKDAESLYLTIDLDAYSAAFAPGVSAASPRGLSPEDTDPLIRALARSGKLVGFDAVELCPRLDIDGGTAALAAGIIWRVFRDLIPSD